jgi:hypothetical protein
MRLRIIALALAAAAALLGACRDSAAPAGLLPATTPAGLLAPPTDCRSRLKPEVRGRAPADADAVETSTRISIGDPPSNVVVKWRYFKIGNAGYLLSYDATLENRVEGSRVEFIPDAVVTLVGTDGEPNDFLTVEVRWRRGFAHRSRAFRIDGYGLSACVDPD